MTQLQSQIATVYIQFRIHKKMYSRLADQWEKINCMCIIIILCLTVKHLYLAVTKFSRYWLLRQIFLFIGCHNPIMRQSSDAATSSKEIPHLTKVMT